MQYNTEDFPDDRDFSEISLEGLGSHIFAGEVNEETTREAITFILKANHLFRADKCLNLFINTPGGNVYDGFGLIDIMSMSRLPIKTIGMGNVMSMGVLILCSGTKGKRIMTKNTQVMAHQFYSGTNDKFHEVVAAFKADLYLEQQIREHFKKHTAMSEKQISEIMFGASDKWLTPAECKKFGLVDHVIEELPHFDISIPQVVKQPPVPSSQSSGRRRK